MDNLLYFILITTIGVGLVVYLGITVIEVLRSQIERRDRLWIIGLVAGICLLAGTCFAGQVAYIYGPMIPGQPRKMIREVYKSGTMGTPHLRDDAKAIRQWYTAGEPWISVWIRLSQEPQIPPSTKELHFPLYHPKVWHEVNWVFRKR